MGSQAHKIRKQYLKLTLDTEKDAFKHQTAFRDVFYEKVLPAFEEVFDRHCPEDVTIRFDQIELDLGDVHLEDIEGKFVEAATQALATQLGLLIPKAKQGSLPNAEILPRSQTELDLLIGFLRTGTLPWWSGSKGIDPRKVLQNHLDAKPGALRDRLLRENPDVTMVRRLANQFAPTAVIEVLRLMESANASPAADLALSLQTLISHPQTVFSWTMSQALEAIAVEVLTASKSGFTAKAGLPEQSEPRFKALLAAILQVLSRKTGQPVRTLLAELKKALARTGSKSSAPLRALQVAVEEEQDSRSRSRKQKDRPDSEVRTVPEKDSPSEENERGLAKGENEDTEDGKAVKKTRPDSEPTKGPAWRLDDHEEIYIENSGLVLLGGFLEFFFENLGYFEEKQFRDEESQVRAVYLLQFLVSGELEGQAEEEMPLNKILCGYPLTEALPKLSTPLTKREIEEGENLLKAVVGYWKALGSISIEDLRRAFLIREGKLTENGGAWKLKVDRQTLDVMLESIPWTIGMIEHPWMESSIEVDW